MGGGQTSRMAAERRCSSVDTVITRNLCTVLAKNTEKGYVGKKCRKTTEKVLVIHRCSAMQHDALF
eukprot:366212-Chlamydomonas_euryale.AAC.54